MIGLTARLKKRIPAAQLLKYALVGLLSNGIGYVLYLFLIELGSTPKLTMTALYITGALISFVGNQHLTFSYHVAHSEPPMARFRLRKLPIG